MLPHLKLVMSKATPLCDMSYFSPTVCKNFKIKRLKTASKCYFQDVKYSSTYISTISCKKIQIICHKIQISASFFNLGHNPRMTSKKIHFYRTSCGDFVLASKMRPKFDCWTPPYFCDFGIFDKVAVTFRTFKKNLKSDTEV